jgi:hypothetical protein
MNPETQMTLDEAVGEVLGLLTGLELTYAPELDRYRAITRQLNRALRANALDNEWSYYASVYSLGSIPAGGWSLAIPPDMRVRINDDDAVRFVNDEGIPVLWAYILPRDSLHKYAGRRGLWCSVLHGEIRFSRPISAIESGMDVQVPVMREPTKFRLPPIGEEVEDSIREQLVDFIWPDLIIGRAAYFYAQTDPVMQPRVQTLEQDYKNLMYQLIERDTEFTDSPYLNEFIVPVESSDLRGSGGMSHLHPHSSF